MIDKAPMALAQGGVAWSRPRDGGTGARVRRSPSTPGSGMAKAALGPALARAAAAAGVWGLPALLGFVMGRAAVFGVLLPFGTAFCAALAAQRRARRALAAALGAAAGGWTSLAPMAPGAGPLLAAALLPWVGLAAASALARRPGASPWLAAAGAGLAAAAVRLGLAWSMTGDLFAAGATGAAELAAALVLVPAAGLAGLRPAALSQGQVVSLLALAGLTTLGLHGAAWQGMALAPFVARALLLAVAAVGGPGFGAAAGAGLGLVAFLAVVPGPAPARLPWEAAVLPPAGLLAGLGALLGPGAGKPAAAFGLLLAHGLLAPLAASGAEIGHALLHCLAAAGFLMVLPAPLLRAVAARLPGTPERERRDRVRHHEARAQAQQQLQRVAAILEELGHTFAAPPAAGAGEEAPFERFVARVCHEVCGGCSRHAHCWERHMFQTYRDLMATAAAASPDGPLRAQDLAEGLRQRCIQPPHLLKGLGRIFDSMRVEAYWRHRLEESRELVPRQLAGMAAIIAGVAGQMERAGAPAAGGRPGAGSPPGWAPRFDVDVSVVQAPQADSAVSGDCFRRVDLGPDQVAFILSDGMGTGPRAAAESQAAVAMLQRFLEAGFDLDFAVRTINTVLLLRSPEETYATLDACVVDLAEGTARMLKVGAPPSFVCRGGEDGGAVDVVRASSLPVGILSRVETRIVTRRLQPGDVVVMVTDGVLEACQLKGDREEALRRTLERVAPADAHGAVDTVFARLRQRTGPAFPDDVTIVAFQLTERGPRARRRAHRPPAGRGWPASRASAVP